MGLHSLAGKRRRLLPFTLVAGALFQLNAQTANATNYVSQANGQWTNSSTWFPAGIPTSADNVAISHTVTLTGASSALGVTLSSGGSIVVDSNTFSVGGDLDLDGGSFTFTTGTISFNGTGHQKISGALNANNVSINNTAPTPNDTDCIEVNGAITATGTLSVADGQFIPPSGSSFRNIVITSGGILKPESGAEIFVTGLSGGFSFLNSGVFDHNGGKLVFQSAAAQNISCSSVTTFNDIDVINSAAVPDATNDAMFSGNYVIDGTINMIDGQTTLSIATVRNIEIRNGATLSHDSIMHVTGDWSQAGGGSYVSGGNQVTFDGSGHQVISGSPTFAMVAISNSAPTPGDAASVFTDSPITVTGTLTITDGQFTPASGTVLRSIMINPGSILKPQSGAEVTINGVNGSIAFNNGGTFTHNNGKIIFTHSATQSVVGSVATAFNDIDIINTAAAPSSSNDTDFVGTVSFEGDFRVLDGQCTVNSSFKNVEVAADGFLVTGGSNISGDLTIDAGGTLSPTSFVTFNGSGPQAITGSATFAGLTINNTAATPSDTNAVTADSPITCSGTLLVADGQFMPPDGSSIFFAQINAAGILKPVAGATITITGSSAGTALSNSGTFTHNGGKIVLQQASLQQDIISAVTLNNLDIVHSAAVPATSNDVQLGSLAVVAGNLNILDGMCSTGISIKNVNVSADGIWNHVNTTVVTGDITLSPGAVYQNPGASQLQLNGTGPQSISGSFTTGGTVLVNNTAPVPGDAAAIVCADPITINGTLSIADGQFMPADGSSFRNISINPNGILKPEAAGTINVTGALAGSSFANSGSFVHNSGKVVFNSSAGQLVNCTVATVFNDLDINNTAAVPGPANDLDFGGTVSIAGQFTLLDGQCTGALAFHDVLISPNGILNLGSSSVSGDFIKDPGGVLTGVSASINCNGNGPQLISGALSLSGLTINNTAASPSDTAAVVADSAITTSQALTVTDGQFMPVSGSTFRNVAIGAAGILKPVAGATININGASGTIAFLNDGSFIHNNGKVVINGSIDQVVGDSTPTTFYDFEVSNTAANPLADFVFFSGNFTILNDLNVLDGQCAFSHNAKDIYIGPNGVFSHASNCFISGDLTLDAGGTFIGHPSQPITFNGSGLQTISGAIPFGFVTILNTAATPSDSAAVVTTSAVSTAGQLTINDGQFMPASGSSFRNIVTGVNGILKPAAAATMTITGASSGSAISNSGTFIHNSGKVVYSSSSGQSTTSASAIDFNDVEVINTAASPSAANDCEFAGAVRVLGTLDVLDGQTTCGSLVHDVNIAANGILAQPSAFLVSVTGDWTKDPAGTFIPHATVGLQFAGPDSQSINGATTFNTLIINNQAPAPGDSAAVVTTSPISANAILFVADGQFMPATGSTFQSIQINPSGILKPQAASTITVAGAQGANAFNNVAGSFIHNNGTLRFQSATAQDVIASVPTIFYDVEVNNSAATPDTTNDLSLADGDFSVANKLTILDGMCTNSIQNNDVEIAADGILNSGAALLVRGDWTQLPGGQFLANNGYVTFNGLARQEITGGTQFDNLSVFNGAARRSDAEAVVSIGPVNASGQLYLFDGQFTPADGSSFDSIFIGGSSVLKPAAGADISITGADTGLAMWKDAPATFDPNGGTVRFTGAGEQRILATSDIHFFNVEVANTAATPSEIDAVSADGVVTVAEMLQVQDGAVKDFSSLKDLDVLADGLVYLTTSTLTIAGDITNLGVVDADESTVVFAGSGAQAVSTSSAIEFGALEIDSGAILDEVGPVDQLSVSGALTLDGTLRRTHSVAGPATLTGGLTGATVDLTNAGTLTSLVIDRIASVPNAGPDHIEPASWTFDTAGGSGYSASVTFPHSLAIPSQANVSRYLGTGTDWDFVQDAFTSNSATRNNVTDLSSIWAIANVVPSSVSDWGVLED